ncbi:3-phosphoglycerate dehydrogenase [candidate division WOR-3 bacterium RBG_13_43_14]|uniref:3-phosphoglycerate dehydrogenase n=1 Tax=candidate division WOR-3 bacterium RBG_13_43_14 TaxID=1802590 RepID=A0A1F4U1M2_UNCW3|nr:MAG: 3-phosphoglycerate dehydrogenase [candidate division WOR-3 bacterium RBG_13_43_14]
MKVLISDPIASEGIELLKAAGHEVVEKPGQNPADLVNTIPDFNAIIVRSATKVTKEVIEAGKNLKVIGRAGVGLDNVDRETAKAKGIKVVNTPAATSISVAELALGMMFAAARMIPQATVSTKAGKWEKKKFKGTELYGKTLGIIGIGRIGLELAKRAKALGMKVLAYDPYVKTSDLGEIVDLDTLLKESDYISLHIPKTDETKHILNKAAFNKMKKGAVLVNCARGGVVDENALFDALQTGQVGIACLDVYEIEPAKEHQLFSLEQVILTPHIGAQTAEGQLRAGTQIAELVRDALK